MRLSRTLLLFPQGCDDGNNNDYDGCSNRCTVHTCGNGSVEVGEDCDDGGNVAGDGCSPWCESECGNGIINAGEVRAPPLRASLVPSVPRVMDVSRPSLLFLRPATTATLVTATAARQTAAWSPATTASSTWVRYVRHIPPHGAWLCPSVTRAMDLSRPCCRFAGVR